MAKNFNRSQTAHRILARINYDKAHNVKNDAKKTLFNAKVDYHNEVYNMQRNRGEVLRDGERSSLYNHFMRKHGVFKQLRKSR